VLLPVDDHHRFAVHVLLVFRHAELVHQRVDAVLARPDPCAATIDPRSVWENFGVGAAADTVTSFEQGHRATRLFQPQRSGQSRKSSAYYAKVNLCHDCP
jgi:hypothetical protein